MNNNTVACTLDPKVEVFVTTTKNFVAGPSGTTDLSCGLPYFLCSVATAINLADNNVTIFMSQGSFSNIPLLEISKQLRFIGSTATQWFNAQLVTNSVITMEKIEFSAHGSLLSCDY